MSNSCYLAVSRAENLRSAKKQNSNPAASRKICVGRSNGNPGGGGGAAGGGGPPPGGPANN